MEKVMNHFVEVDDNSLYMVDGGRGNYEATAIFGATCIAAVPVIIPAAIACACPPVAAVMAGVTALGLGLSTIGPLTH